MRFPFQDSFYSLSAMLLHATLLGLLLAPAVSAQDDSGFKFIEITVNDPDGKPLSNVAVDIDTAGMQFPMPTNDEGKISLNVPSGADNRLELRVKHEDYAATSVSWQGGDAIPAKFTIPLETGYPIGGIVRDEKGEPIEGVKIEAATPTGTMYQGKLQTLLRGELATTDKDGKWQFLTSEKVPRKLLLKLSHPEYISDPSPRVYATWEELKKLDHPMTLKKGITLRGKVTDPDGEPIAGAMLLLGTDSRISNKQETESDADGKYQFSNVPAGSTMLTVAARDWAPEVRTVVAKKEMEAVDFPLQQGRTLKVLVTDVDGVPVEGATVAAESRQG